MITAPAPAEKIFRVAFRAFADLDATLGEIVNELSPEELAACKRAVARCMGELQVELLMPLLKAHPHLQPDEWRES